MEATDISQGLPNTVPHSLLLLFELVKVKNVRVYFFRENTSGMVNLQAFMKGSRLFKRIKQGVSHCRFLNLQRGKSLVFIRSLNVVLYVH